MTYDGTTTYTYDAENRIISAVNSTSGTSTYVYDALGRRVEKSTSAGKIDYIFDLAGNVVTEWYVNYSNYTGWGVSHIYFNGNLLAQYRYGTTQFMHKDHLGSTRLVTNLNQSIADNIDYLPFGEQYSGSSVTSHKFTGKERDSETGLDNFGARYDSSALGRFMSPDWSSDPEPVPYAKLGNPQTLNLYAYVNNNPINAVDLDGHSYAMFSTRNDASGGDLPMADSFFSTGDDNTDATPRSSQAQQLNVQQVAQIIRQAQQSKSDPVTTAINIFNNLGDNVTVSGDVLRSALDQTKVAVTGNFGKMIGDVQTITKSGSAVDITLAKNESFRGADGKGVDFAKHVSFQVQVSKDSAAFKNIKGVDLRQKAGSAAPQSVEVYKQNGIPMIHTEGKAGLIGINLIPFKDTRPVSDLFH